MRCARIMVALAAGVFVSSCAPIQQSVAPDGPGRDRAALHNEIAFIILGIDGVQVADRSAPQHYTILPGEHVLTVVVDGMSSFRVDGREFIIPLRSASACAITAELKPGHEYWVTGDLKIERLKFDPHMWDAWLIEGQGETGRRVAECVHFPRERRKRNEHTPLIEVRLPSPPSHGGSG